MSGTEKDHDILIRVETKVDLLTDEVKKINDKVSSTLFRWVIGIMIVVLMGISGRQMIQSAQLNINKTNIEHLISDYKTNK